MEERNLDFNLPMTREQWEGIGRRAKDLRPSGFDWDEKDPEHIHVYLRDEEARGIWKRLVSDEEVYGAHQIEVAQIHYNDGRPYAHLEAQPSLDEPVITTQEEEAASVGEEKFVRDKWHYLLKESGLHFDFGHVPRDVE